MNHFLELLKSWGPLGAFLFALVDGLGVPNPGGPDYLLLFLAYTNPAGAYVSALLATLGSALGSLGLYGIARRGGRRFLDAKTSGPRGQKFRLWFKRYGLVTIFIPALVPMVPLPMKVFVLCAGAFAVHPLVYLATFLVGRAPRYFGLAYLGTQLGEHSKQWLLDHKWHFIGAAAVLVIFCVGVVRVSEWIRMKRGDAMGSVPDTQ